MIKRLGMALYAMAVALTITGCAHPNADREGHLLGDIYALKSVAANGTNISEVRKVLGTPSYVSKTADGDVYVYSYKVNFPFEGYNPALAFVNEMRHNKANVLNDDIEAVAMTNKNIALKTDNSGIIKENYVFGYKYLYSRTAKGTAANAYCVTELTDEDLKNGVNFSRYIIEADTDKQQKTSADFDLMLNDKLNKLLGEKLALNKNVTINKEDGEKIAAHPKLLINTYCNEITCNK